MATELGTAYINIVPSADGISGSIRSLLDPESEKAGESGGKKAGQSFRSKFANHVKSATIDLANGFTNAAAIGASAIAGVTASLTNSALSGGIARAIGIDETRAKFKQLGYDADDMTDSIITGLGQSKYALNEAGSTAVNFASAGIKQGKEMEEAIASVASVASISGREFNEIGNIYTKVASTGKLTGGVMSQLQENGINANAALQKALNKTSEEIDSMVANGEIDFQTFANAMTAYFGDAGESAMATFSGSLDNIKTVLNRIAASFMGPAIEAVRQFFAGAEGQEGLFQALEKIEERLQPIIDKFSEFATKIGGQMLNAIGSFNTVLDDGGSIMDAFKAALMELIPDSIKEKFTSLDGGTQSLIGGLGKLLGIVGGGAAAWGAFSGAISTLVPGLGKLLGPLLGSGGAFKMVKMAGGSVVDIFKILTGSTGSVTTGFGKLIGGLGKFAGPVAGIVAAFVLMYTKSEAFRNAVNNLITTIVSSLTPIIQALMPTLTLIMAIIGKVAQLLGNILAPAINLVASIVAAVASYILDRINLVREVLTTVVAVVVAVFYSIKTAIMGPINAVITVVRSQFNAAKEAIIKPFETARDKVKGIIDKIKGFFKFSVSAPHIPLPHFSISPSGWKIGDLLKGSIPKLSIKWYDKGGIFTQPSVIGVGERRPEFVGALDDLRKIVREESGGGGNITINVYAHEGMDVNALAAAVEQRLIQTQKRRTMAWV